MRAIHGRIEHAADRVLRAFDIIGCAREHQTIPVGVNAHVETIFQDREVLIERSKERNVIGEAG
jgi:hypothetical protein